MAQGHDALRSGVAVKGLPLMLAGSAALGGFFGWAATAAVLNNSTSSRGITTEVHCTPGICQRIQSEECRGFADAGVWEAIPFCHRIDGYQDEEIESMLDESAKDAGPWGARL
jgi:hypothetical protein